VGAIFGVWGPASDAELRAMGRAIAHRGKAVHIRRYSDDLAVGAIGAGPERGVISADRVVLVCDAAIYNADDVLAHLRGKGIACPGAMPAGILHELYEREGPEGLERVNGDYAFALIDRRRGEIVFGRDYIGNRPLYYTVLPSGGVAFASEYKALIQLSEVRPEIDLDMVQYLQCAKTLPAGRTLLANISEVPPTGTTRLSRAGVVLARTEFAPMVVDARITDEAEAIDSVRRLLTEALGRRSRDLNPIGVALSGGIDSTGIAFLLRDLYPDRLIHTFTVGYGPDDPEIITAARVARAIGSVHHEVTVGPDLAREQLYPLVWHLEDPSSRSEALQLYWLGRAARDHVDALITGDSADCLFAGMPRHKLLRLMEWLPWLRRPLHEFYDLTQLGLPPQRLLAKIAGYAYQRGRVPPVPRVWGARMPGSSSLPPVGAEFVNVNCAKVYPHLGERRSYKHDRAYGAWGLEARSPFHDVEFARAAFTITDRLKIRGRADKYVLRKAVATVVPEEFGSLPKFPQRMRYDLEFAEALDAVAVPALADEEVQRRGLFEPDGIRRLFRRRADRPYSPEAAMRLWTAVLTEYWAQQFVDRRRAIEHSPGDRGDHPGRGAGVRSAEEVMAGGP
jgi:asparagine synthase (glutamine-hydrolysing)